MVENNISEVFKWFIYIILIFAAFAMFLFFYELGQTNRFSSFVAAEIERGGVQIVGNVVVDSDDGDVGNSHFVQEMGFTPDADERIRAENERYYGGRYNVSFITEVDPDTDLTYGQLIDYEVTGDYKVLFSWFDVPLLKSTGQSIIQVRTAGSDGQRTFARSMFDYDDFTYQDVDGISMVTGFSTEGVQKHSDLSSQGLMNDFIAPDKNPSSKVSITHIADDAFANYNFNGDFIAPNIKVIGRNAFKNSSSFNGAFNAPNVLKIGDFAFDSARFVGDFKAELVQSIGAGSFRRSTFNGVLDVGQVESIGADAYMQSTFSGNFNTPLAQSVGAGAFQSSRFEGYFNAPKLESIGSNAFANGVFTNGVVSGNKFVKN